MSSREEGNSVKRYEPYDMDGNGDTGQEDLECSDKEFR